MSQTFVFIADLYPWWGIPLAFIFAELGNYYRRHNRKKASMICLWWAFFFLAIAALYFYANGFQKLRPGIHEFEKQYLNKK